ncbi:hypothetical protein B0T11DRAFT_136537 [Plectosphaerella cucumerina]|uniref:Uncharacterized protein n=1 Tax=Plectosphaerella cucumerina TaxID=40658 RepID=A0A8K0TCL5_9PEZI|nr:hypothetical protein B0T11DRAFT_136537 [Plectosphaerella cucumerina]
MNHPLPQKHPRPSPPARAACHSTSFPPSTQVLPWPHGLGRAVGTRRVLRPDLTRPRQVLSTLRCPLPIFHVLSRGLAFPLLLLPLSLPDWPQLILSILLPQAFSRHSLPSHHPASPLLTHPQSLARTARRTRTRLRIRPPLSRHPSTAHPRARVISLILDPPSTPSTPVRPSSAVKVSRLPVPNHTIL